ncbi:uncharacterized protein A4U43_C05F15350 [Asparagus officinalis]|uniref:Jacalin-type lectin domain-containing protein n=2 Tax=Asparagus officinalis TaxID=4686 RepID=A0A5P1ERT5_ASPOF|nr:uncharacterized protein A4U43_C05F15350 [Asparagus officinalis]
MSRKHGGAEDNFTMINFSEPLTCVSGHYGPFCFDNEAAIFNREDEDEYLLRVINSLKFSTARNTYGPFGTERGTPFSFQTVTEITGFHGIRPSSVNVGHLHAIGVYVRCPATQYIDDPATQVVVKYEKT